MPGMESIITEKDFWQGWAAFAPAGIHTLEIESQPPVNVKNVTLSLAVDACWFLLMDETFCYWKNEMRKKNSTGASLAESPLLRRRMIDAWMELQLARTVHEEAMAATADQQLTCARLARVWLMRCLKIFAVEMPLHINLREAPWQKQARVFIQGGFFVKDQRL
jgi:hypothetical protein